MSGRRIRGPNNRWTRFARQWGINHGVDYETALRTKDAIDEYCLCSSVGPGSRKRPSRGLKRMREQSPPISPPIGPQPQPPNEVGPIVPVNGVERESKYGIRQGIRDIGIATAAVRGVRDLLRRGEHKDEDEDEDDNDDDDNDGDNPPSNLARRILTAPRRGRRRSPPPRPPGLPHPDDVAIASDRARVRFEDDEDVIEDLEGDIERENLRLRLEALSEVPPPLPSRPPPPLPSILQPPDQTNQQSNVPISRIRTRTRPRSIARPPVIYLPRPHPGVRAAFNSPPPRGQNIFVSSEPIPGTVTTGRIINPFQPFSPSRTAQVTLSPPPRGPAPGPADPRLARREQQNRDRLERAERRALLARRRQQADPRVVRVDVGEEVVQPAVPAPSQLQSSAELIEEQQRQQQRESYLPGLATITTALGTILNPVIPVIQEIAQAAQVARRFTPYQRARV